MIGRAVSHYRVVDTLGRGGMGVVYLAEDGRLGRQVALKFLPPNSTPNQTTLERFRIEARAASSLSHPGICTVFDVGDDEGTPYIVMEALKGENLRDRIKRGPMKVAEVLDLAIQLADALDAAHAQGIIHRDIKPSNIFVGDKNRVKILDFGLAKLALSQASGPYTGDTIGEDASTRHAMDNQLTLPGSPLGTVMYMSPEQARGEEVDARTDLFSLGTVMYEMATGTQAFDGSTPVVVLAGILNRTPPSIVERNALVPPRLEIIIRTALEKDRDLRYQHASDLQADLKRLRRDLDSSPSMASVPGVTAGTLAQPAPQSAPAASTGLTPAWRHGIIAIGIVLAGALGALFWSGRPGTIPPPSPERGGSASEALSSSVLEPAPAVPSSAPAPAPMPGSAAASANPASLAPSTTRPAPESRHEPAPAPAAGATVLPVLPSQSAVAQTASSQPTPSPLAVPETPVAPAPAAPMPAAGEPIPATSPAPAGSRAAAPPSLPPPPLVTRAAPPETPAAAVETDEAAIRRTVATYQAAVEKKDIALFRSVRPGLSATEETRLRDSFRQIESQQVSINIEEIRVEGRAATVRLSRQDSVVTGGRRQTQNSRQTLRLEKTGPGWIITDLR